MTTREIRRRFLDYFASRDHQILPSAPLVPYEDDPSVLLTIAGMQPLKQYFLGTAAPPAPRLTSSQKCFRTNDIDEVGHTARHLTFFEMLGNFSIGDYFKREAIQFGFEVSTEVFGLDPDQIWITVFEGMDGVPADDEAVEHWVDLGVPRDRIQALGESENFWKAGPTGPCGPNTELYLDRGRDWGPDGGPATGTDRFLEFWNLVFMQYERSADGSLRDLPAQNIDTGAGLERIAALLQDAPSVFETDAFRPLVDWAERESGTRYGESERGDRALRVLADHGRAMTFLAGDGVRPGNEGRSYVLRRIIRRAVSEASRLGLAPDAVVGLATVVAEQYGDAYPEVVERAAEIADVLTVEAEQFARTLAQGQRLLEDVIAGARASGTVSGEDAFRLYDTYGFPLDLTLGAAADAGLAVDEAGFAAMMEDQRARSRRRARADGDDVARIMALASSSAPTRFVGHDRLESETEIVALEDLGGGRAALRLAESPFYAEGGGQISDAGTLAAGDAAGPVTAVHRVGDDQVLVVELPVELAVGQRVTARVDATRRALTAANHTGTHLLNWALRSVVGDGVRQAGSYVGPDKLRFDFTHGEKIPAADLARIEELVTGKIADDDPVQVVEMPRSEADALGAIGLFEEKYGEVVRVVSAGDYSRELCGGTHVARTGEIGPFAVVAEASVGAGARRVEALTGAAVAVWFEDRERALRADLDARAAQAADLEGELAAAGIAADSGAPSPEVPEADPSDVAALRRREAALEDAVAAGNARISQLERALADARRASADPAGLAASAEEAGLARLVIAEVPAGDMNELLALTTQVRDLVGAGAAVVLGARADGKAMVVANLGDEAVAAGLSAAVAVDEAAGVMGGGGGGRPDMARAGGRSPEALPDALAAAAAALRAAAA